MLTSCLLPCYCRLPLPSSPPTLSRHCPCPCPYTTTQHYAAKALENVFGLGGAWAQRLANDETAGRLLEVGPKGGKVRVGGGAL